MARESRNRNRRTRRGEQEESEGFAGFRTDARRVYMGARAPPAHLSSFLSLFLSLAPGDKSPLVVFCPSLAFSSFSPRASRFSIASSSSSSSAASLFLLFFCVSYSSYTCDYTYRAGELTCSESSLLLSLSLFLSLRSRSICCAFVRRFVLIYEPRARLPRSVVIFRCRGFLQPSTYMCVCVYLLQQWIKYADKGFTSANGKLSQEAWYLILDYSLRKV